MRVLAGDIGGTSARLAIVEVDTDAVRVVHSQRFTSKDFPRLAPIVRAFLTDVVERPSRACFAIACPVFDGKCRGTNLAWDIDVRALREAIGVPRTEVINDLQAIGHGLRRLGPTDLLPLQVGEPNERGVVAVIGAGTGLGEAFVTRRGDTYQVHSSEGGHTSFGAQSDLECGLQRWLAKRFGHVSYERIVSGPGLVSIYQYLRESGEAEEQAGVRSEMERADPAAVISRLGLAGTDQLCVRALDMFVSAYGAKAGNFALTVMATGGMYIAGGIAPRIAPKLRDGAFMTAFRDKGRLSDVLARIPVNIVTNPHVGLIGAAMVAMRQCPGCNGRSAA
jgi:glucokinase